MGKSQENWKGLPQCFPGILGGAEAKPRRVFPTSIGGMGYSQWSWKGKLILLLVIPGGNAFSL